MNTEPAKNTESAAENIEITKATRIFAIVYFFSSIKFYASLCKLFFDFTNDFLVITSFVIGLGLAFATTQAAFTYLSQQNKILSFAFMWLLIILVMLQ